ncbi:hypothetical protein ACFZCL_19575 [Streptomyces sp. NPDC008159]|uniref:SbtR family transcriptional regulator n=1 Tax=Streptomyces sp. NPDC008159 TaxID=3364817 RepID=UPI0036E239BB
MDVISDFLARVTEATATNRAVRAAARALGADPVDRDAEARAGAALAALIRAGQADGDIHQDVTVDDIYLLFSTAPTDQPPAARARWLSLVLTGLTTHREREARPLTRPSTRPPSIFRRRGRTFSTPGAPRRPGADTSGRNPRPALAPTPGVPSDSARDLASGAVGGERTGRRV